MSSTEAPSISAARLMSRLNELAQVCPIDGGGNCRLALTAEDKLGRDLVLNWMKELGLAITIDTIGNVTGTWNTGSGAPVMTGSHIDTVRTGGRFDGNYGVLAGLEVIETCQTLKLELQRPLAVTFFTNEEGARFAPDMLGSLVYVGGMQTEDALDVLAIDGPRLGDELEAIGYNGSMPCPGVVPHAFIELHIEQGPLLEAQGFVIGAVTGVQGISWQEIVIEGQSNHAGTTPMSLRHDAAYIAARITVFLRELALRFGDHQVCTVGKLDLFPNLVNVVAARATLTLDVRNTDEHLLQQAEREIADFMQVLEAQESVTISARQLVRFKPVVFDERVIALVDTISKKNGHSVKRMPSGAGHDAQMLARVCPSGMIFVPSVNGISHNAAEFTNTSDLVAGANVLLQAMIALTSHEFASSAEA
ncbi:MAG: Zn-dependent hydrolase [Ilumatobacteraceae bacterium]|nr:Zn-dependent hydrolase [Ilumatobacteraceae bacterium]